MTPPSSDVKNRIVLATSCALANIRMELCRKYTSRIGAFPIGIDPEEFGALALSPEAQRQSERMKESLAGRKLVIGVDRLDYTKGLLERIRAFDRLLELYPDNQGHITLVQITPRSRSDVQEYIDMRHELEAAAGRINGRFAEFDWVPVRYINRAYSRRSLAGLFRASDVGLVTPLRDGMNLVAKEYVAAQEPENPGVLVLSRFAGAARQLDGALIVNPYDTKDVAENLQAALEMPLEARRERWAGMMKGLKRDDITTWRNRFIDALRAASRLP